MLAILNSPLRISLAGSGGRAELAGYLAAICDRMHQRLQAVLQDPASAMTAAAATRLTAAEHHALTVVSDASKHPVERIDHALGAGGCASELLGLLAAAHLDKRVSALLRNLQPDLHLGVDLDTASRLVSAAAIAKLSCLRGELMRLGLVTTRDLGLRKLIAVTPRLLALYEGVRASDPMLSEVGHWRRTGARDAAGVIAPADLDQLVETLRGVFDACIPPLALFCGSSATGRTRLAQAVAARLGLDLVLVVDAPLLPHASAELIAVLRALELDARYMRGVLVLRQIEALDPDRRRLVESVLARFTAPTIITTTSEDLPTLEGMVGWREVVRRPNQGLRRAAWEAELTARGRRADTAELDALAIGYPLAHSAIARAVDLAVARDSRLEIGGLHRAAASQVRSHLDRYAKRLVPTASLDEIVLAEDTLDQVHELLMAVMNRPALGYANGPRGLAALFNGPPGTGKTMTANAIANALKLPLYRIDVSSIVDRYVGETEKNLARIFEEAEGDRGILLFDEADSLFTKRVEVSDSNDRYANMQVNMLLNLIDEYTGIVILTTNLKASIDTAFMRRMSFKVTFEAPEADERAALWKAHIPPNVRLGRDVDLDELGHEFRASGGEIRNAVYRALLMDVEGKPLTKARLTRAMELELEAGGYLVHRAA